MKLMSIGIICILLIVILYETSEKSMAETNFSRDDGEIILLTRAPDLRQAQNTSNIKNIKIWEDKEGSSPSDILKDILLDLSLKGKNIGIEYIMGSANFYVIKTHNEEQLIKALLKKGFYVRPLSNFHNSKIEGVRVAIGTEKINKNFLNAIQEAEDENNID